jgi:hypothetical protein
MPIVESAIADATRTIGKTANGAMDADDDDDFDYDGDIGSQSIEGDEFGRGTLAAHGNDGGGRIDGGGCCELSRPRARCGCQYQRLLRRRRRRRLRLRWSLNLPPLCAEAQQSHARSRGTHALAPVRQRYPFLSGKPTPALILLPTSMLFGATPHCSQLPSHPSSSPPCMSWHLRLQPMLLPSLLLPAYPSSARLAISPLS